MTARPQRGSQPELVVPGCDDDHMSLTATPSAAVSPAARVEVLFEELAELAGQRNAIDGRIVKIVAELDRDELCGATGARSVAALVAWKLGCSSGNAHTITTVARRLEEFPRCAAGMWEGRLSLDQVGVVAARAGEGSDEHYAELARSRRSTSCAPRSNWNRDPNPIRRRSHSPRSPRLPARTSAVGGSHLRTRTRRSSMQHWPLTVTRCSPSGSRITAQATAHRKIVPRCPPPSRRLCA